jgi:hypothetical protein
MLAGKEPTCNKESQKLPTIWEKKSENVTRKLKNHGLKSNKLKFIKYKK